MYRIKTVIIFVLFHFSHQANAQCTNHVTHIIGTANVAGTNVTIADSGCADLLSSYCPSVTSPYIIGFDPWTASTAYCSGYYGFQFSPPIDSLTLNFSGITKTPDHEEIVMVRINGNHYPIPAAGGMNNCDSMAVLDVNGNVAACDDCIESGWVGTTIYGPISEVIIFDSVIIGFPGGALFSLFISDVTADIPENITSNLNVSPNPFVNEFEVNASSEGIIVLFDVSGKRVLEHEIVAGNNTIGTQNLLSGAYIANFVSSDGSVSYQKMMKP